MVDDKRAVLAVFTREGCGPCMIFEKWKGKMLEQLGNNVRVVQYHLDKNKTIPKYISDFTMYTPCFVLFSPKSYYKFYSKDNKFIGHNLNDKEELKALIFGSAKNDEIPGQPPAKYSLPFRSHNPDDISDWVLLNISNVHRMDLK